MCKMCKEIKKLPKKVKTVEIHKKFKTKCYRDFPCSIFCSFVL